MPEASILFFCRILAVLLQFIEGWYFMKCIDCCLQRRSRLLSLTAGLTGYAAVSGIVIQPGDLVNITSALAAFILLNFLLYKGTWAVRLSLAVILLPVSSALNLLVFEMTGALYFQYFTESDTLPNAVCSSLSCVFPTLFFYFFYRRFHGAFEKMREMFTARAWGLMAIICAASFAGVFSCLYLVPEQDSYYIWPCMAACIVTNTGGIHLASYLADGLHADLERKNLQLMNHYYQELENSQNQIRRLRHDMNSHLSVAGQLLEEGEAEKAQAYLAELSGIVCTASRRFCQNSIVNAVLNARYSQMLDAGIDVFFQVSIDGMMFIDDVSLCTIFANLLDNAIEACEKIAPGKERKIQLKCRYTENGYFSLELSNSKANKITEKKGRFVTDKDDRRMHGIGISSVRSIVEKYRGTLDISYDEYSFLAVILIG